jgi:hypothetical protein
MKKQQIAAAACLVAGAIGFAAVYSTQNHGKEELPTLIFKAPQLTFIMLCSSNRPYFLQYISPSR